MHSRLFLILLVSVISKSFYANGVKQTESLLENRFLLLDNQTPPKLVYICLKNDFPIDLNQTRHEVEKIAELDWEKISLGQQTDLLYPQLVVHQSMSG